MNPAEFCNVLAASDEPDRRKAIAAALRDPAQVDEWATVGPQVLAAWEMEVGEIVTKRDAATLLRAVRVRAKELDGAVRKAASEARKAERQARFDRVLDAATIGPERETWELLRMSGEDPPKPDPCAWNLGTILRTDSRWTGRVRWNDFRDEEEILDGDKWRVLRDVDDVDIGRQIAEWYRLDYSSAAVHEQLSSVANESRWHPVRAYLEALPDPTSTLIDEWLGDAFGCARTPMTAAIGRAWLVSMVARAMQPGCKVDTVPVLVGIQGAGKSSTLRALMPDPGWYADSEIPLRSSGPDRYQVLRGVWLYEVAELDRYSSKIDASEIKAYLTSQADTYRASYGRRVRTVPRQVVFAGSTNSHEPLVDPTGARRFWPLACGQCDPEWVEVHRDLLWAEAMAIYRRGDSWWLSTEAAAEVAEVADGYRAGDPWEHSIALWLALPAQSLDRYLTISQVLSGAVELPVPQHDQHTQRRAGAVLTRLGWHKTERKSGADGRSGSRMWERPV